jgi:hypothetical protein
VRTRRRYNIHMGFRQHRPRTVYWVSALIPE